MDLGRKILIVEDERVISLNTSFVLKKIGYHVVQICSSVENVVAVLKEKEVELVLMDINLGGDLDGIEIAELIRKDYDLPVIFLTAHFSHDLLSRVKNVNAHAYILKPFSNRELEINIELVLLRHESEKRIKAMHDTLQKTNQELEKKIQQRTDELVRANKALTEEIELGRLQSQAQAQSEKDFRELFENSHDAILIVNPANGSIKKINISACVLYGFTADEFLALRTNDLFFHKKDADEGFEMLESDGGFRAFEAIHHKKNGSLIFVEISVTIILFKKKLALQYIIRDVTIRKNTEKALVENERKYREMTNFLPVPIFEVNCREIITYCNSRAAELFGYAAAEMINILRLTDLIADEEKEEVRKMLTDRVPDKIKEGKTHSARTKHGEELTVVGYFSLYSETGGSVSARVCLVDVGDLTRTQQQLMKLSMVIEQINEVVIITDPKGKIEYVNPAFLKGYGYTVEDVIGKPTSILKSGKQNRQFYKKMWNRINAGEIFSAEFINLRKDNALYYEHKTITPLRNSNGEITHFVSTGRNIIDEKNAEREIYEHQRFIDAVNNTVPLIVCVYDLSERRFTFFNNKLTSILGYLPEDLFAFSQEEFIDLIHPSDRRLMLLAFEQDNYSSDEVYQVAFRIRNKLGEYRIIEFRGVSFGRSDKGVLRQVLGTALDITEQRYHERQLNAMIRLHRLQEKKEQKIRTISLMEGQEEERRRLSRDLHDGIGQLMTAIKMKLDNLSQKLDGSNDAFIKGINDVSNIVKTTIGEVRRVSNDLVPISLYDFGLAAVIKRLLDTVQDKIVSFDSNIGNRRFHSSIEIACYRILQEAINNIQKHSEASEIAVVLDFENDILQMKIEDNGIGFVILESQPYAFIGKGNGLNNMYERSRIIGGKHSIVTSPGNGCRIAVELNAKLII